MGAISGRAACAVLGSDAGAWRKLPRPALAGECPSGLRSRPDFFSLRPRLLERLTSPARSVFSSSFFFFSFLSFSLSFRRPLLRLLVRLRCLARRLGPPASQPSPRSGLWLGTERPASRWPHRQAGKRSRKTSSTFSKRFFDSARCLLALSSIKPPTPWNPKRSPEKRRMGAFTQWTR